MTAGTTPTLFAGLPQWYGLKGSRYKLELRFLGRVEQEVKASYERRFTYRFIAASGHRFEWYTDTDDELSRDSEYVVAFTVKGHRHDPNKTTRIERPSFRLLK